MIKFEHTVFALPFAFLGAFLAAQGLPGWSVSGLVILAMIGARSCAMAFNRLVDIPYDAANPRTSGRALPRGLISRSFVAAFTAVSAAVFVLAAWMLNPLAFYLSPVALIVVLAYSYTKRFTVLSHIFLGLSLGIAPVGGWVAVRGTLDIEPLFLAAAVMFWVAGFDIIYACQDIDFDRRAGLYFTPGAVRDQKLASYFRTFSFGHGSLTRCCLRLVQAHSRKLAWPVLCCPGFDLRA